MEEFNLVLMLLAGGTVMHYVQRRSGDIGIWLMRTFKFGWANSPFLTPKYFSHFNNKGEAVINDVKEIPGLTSEQQTHFDKVLASRLARTEQKFGDYDDLKKFKSEYETQQSAKAQQELENAKKYDEAKKGYETKINEYGQIVSKKDQEIQDLKITHHLSNEISKNNGFIEESIAMLKGNAVLDASGNVKIKSKDANGMDVEMPLSDGVKKFYEQRPHLMRSTHKSGAGTGANDGGGTGAGAGSGQTEDLNSLNAQLVEASKGTDLKKISEVRQKIKAAMSAKGISR